MIEIELAQNAIGEAIRHGADDEAMLWFAQAQAYATIATAEQLQRIAASLEAIGHALDILAHPNRIVAPDPQDYVSEDDYRQAAELYAYHKGSKPGESLDEYRARAFGPEW